jgi:hypothetical protein
MRHGLLLLVAGCGFQSSAGDGDATGSQGGVPETWSFDAASEFGAPGSLARDMTVEARGSLTPSAYSYGGLVAHGLAGTPLWSPSDTSWSKVDTATPTGAGMWCGEALTTQSALDYLGITTNKSTLSIWFEGEVYLQAGQQQTFTLDANDIAFIDLAPPGSTTFTQVTTSGFPKRFDTQVTGWYPIRIGLSDRDNSSSFNFTHSDTAGAPVAWSRDRLRARTSELTGTLRSVYGRQLLSNGLAGPPVMHFEPGDLLPLTDFDPRPPQGGGDTDWSARHVGQVYVVQPGAYTMTISSDDGNRGRLGSEHGESHWHRDDGVGGGAGVSTVTATLAEGWNDLAVDYNQLSGGQELQVQMSGPDFPTLAPVPRNRLRPVESSDDRLAVGSDNTSHGIVDGGGTAMDATATMFVAGYPGETVASIDLTYEVDSQRWNELKFELETPAVPPVRVTIRDLAANSGGNHIEQLTIPANTAGPLAALLRGPVHGTWKLHVFDVNVGGNNSNLKNANLTLHTTGGVEPIARTAQWTSAVRDATTNVFAIDGITWDARLHDGSPLEVRVRTCQQPDCTDGAWSSMVPAAIAFAVPPGRYLQVRVDMTSNGVQEPELRSLTVAYRRTSR